MSTMQEFQGLRAVGPAPKSALGAVPLPTRVPSRSIGGLQVQAVATVSAVAWPHACIKACHGTG